MSAEKSMIYSLSGGKFEELVDEGRRRLRFKMAKTD